MTHQEKLSKMLAAIESGRTLYIQTALRCYGITSREIAKFEKAGRPLLKADDSGIYMSVGKSYDCINFCKIYAQ